MNKKLLALPLVLILAACGKDEPKQALECNHPAAIQSIKTQIQNIIRQEARAFARNDSRQFVDADKVIAAGSELEIGLNNAQQIDEDNKTMCGADLSIRVPADVLNAAETNSPLIYSETTLAEVLEQKLTGSNLKFADNTLSTSVRYTPDKDGNAVLEDNTVSMTARTLSSLLLPYGVKSIVMIDGKAVSKEDAMKLLKGKHDEPPVVSPEDILENNAASQASGVPQAAGLETEILHPDIEAKREEPSFSQNDLDNARRQNRNADSEIQGVWDGIEHTVQKELLAEQRAWIQNKIQNCQQAAAQADNPAQAEYLKLQCDTRMTRERTQYLRGYSID